ncbi:hypothetical protein ACIQFP_10440 [Nocardiopsis alba]|uniref:DUF7169 domain-containing protein n=1 Tax=Nocardiopsis alba TaxID=53437 RepID=UPI0038013E74
MIERSPVVTRDLARAAIDLHRLTLAAADVCTLESPTTALTSDDGVARPTEHAALCERRRLVVETARDITDSLAPLRTRLARALAEWEGTPPL